MAPINGRAMSGLSALLSLIDVNMPIWERNTGNVWSFTTSTVVAGANFLGWWKFDEKSGNVVWDATGREHHGTITQGEAISLIIDY